MTSTASKSNVIETTAFPGRGPSAQAMSRVLIVDDDPHILSSLKRHLRSRFRVITATCGYDALRQLARHQDCAVVIADMTMPGMNGIDLLCEVRRQRPAITRIMLTGRSEPDLLVEAINSAHVFRFLSKPCRPDDVVEAALAGAELFLQQRSDRPDDTREPGAGSDCTRILSHELRTPLNHIIGFSEILASGQANDPNASRIASYVQESGQQLLDRVEVVIDYLALVHDDAAMTFDTLCLSDVVADCVAKFDQQTSGKSLAITATLASLDRVFLWADRGWLGRALAHVLTNALAFGRRNGGIALHVEPGRGNVTLSVTDDGAGMSQEDLEACFNPFHQAEPVFTRSHEGLGLGLTVARATVETHGGRIAAFCPDEGGTTVAITLPTCAEVLPIPEAPR